MINNKDRIALVGKNGAGKSTLLKIIAGIMQPTQGSVSRPKDLTLGYLPQQMKFTDQLTVREEVEKAFSDIHSMEDEIAAINRELSERTDYEAEDYHKLIDRMTYLTEKLHIIGGGNYQSDLEKTLLGLGFLREDFDRNTSEFSGGWRMRIELAKLLLRRPDVLLLDEPTNHLDIESIEWLENFILTQAKAVLLISHDRAFIENTTTRTIEIELGKIYDYNVKYSEFVKLHQERYEQQLRAYENQQKMIADTEAFIERFRYKPTKSVQVQSRIKQLDKIDRIEVDELDRSAIHLKFPPAPRSGSYPLILEDVGKRFGSHQVFDHASFTVNRGEKVAFVGKNGEGKSTLVKCIMGEIHDYTGSLKLGYNIIIGYFAQNQAQLLDEDKTVFQTIDDVATGDMRTKVRDLLGSFMFGGEAIDKKVHVLSGGEKSRLAMIRLLMQPYNLLILDEPTNHLDMRSKDVLKDALKEFDGTAIIVSHDRDFLNGLVTKVYEFGHQRIREHLGGIYEFLEHKKMDSLQELERQTTDKTATEKIAEPTENKLSYEAGKELSRAIRKAEKTVSDTETRITELETRIEELEQKMTTPEGSADQSLYAEYADLKKEHGAAMDAWTEQTMQLEELKENS